MKTLQKNKQSHFRRKGQAPTIFYSIITDYEWGAAKVLVMPVHLSIDLMIGIFLALSPWILGFSKYIYLPHLLLGSLEVLVSLLSKTIPYESEEVKLMKKRAKYYKG